MNATNPPLFKIDPASQPGPFFSGGVGMLLILHGFIHRSWRGILPITPSITRVLKKVRG
jgi:hypothetical protein